ncbi:MAG: HAMP domain-containing sensor histidine kinase [Bacteroidota bacterium]
MFQTAVKKIISFISTIAGIGIADDLSFHEKKKTQLLNVVVASGLPVNAYFSIHNLLSGRTVLGVINICLLIGGILILVINSQRMFLLSRFVLTILSSALFSTSAVLFRNGGEYFLIANLLVIIIYFNKKWHLIFLTSFNCLLFIGIKIFLTTSYVYGTVPFSRVIFNISWTLLTMLLALLFFKNEQMAYQQQIEEKNTELENLNQTKQKLFSIIAHDLRSPIGQLKGSLDLVTREYLTPDEFRKISSKLSSEVDQLHSTLDNLLRWSISQFQGIVARPENVLLSDVIENKAILFLKQSMERKNICLQFEDAGLSVYADPDHLMLVFRNLVSNAIKYSYQDGIITIRSYRKENKILTEIADRGMGMNEEMKSSIFDPVTMVSSAGTSNEKGTGLGLKLCKEFLEKNDGQIWVETVEQKGTVFYTSLPAAI